MLTNMYFIGLILSWCIFKWLHRFQWSYAKLHYSSGLAEIRCPLTSLAKLPLSSAK